MRTVCIPIHGVGIHKKGDIEKSVKKTLKGTQFESTINIEDFNWDKVAEHSRQHGILDLVFLLNSTAYNISASARVGLEQGPNVLDRFFGVSQFYLNRVSQWLISLGIAGLFFGMLIQFSMRIPAALLGLPVAFAGVVDWMPTLLTLLLCVILLLTISILILSIPRMIMHLSLRPFLVSLRSCFLLYLQPILVIISGAFVIPWKSFSLEILKPAGFILILLLGNYTYSIFKEEVFAFGNVLKITLIIFGALIVPLLTQMFFSKGWFEGPIKIILDIFRYIGEPDYRDLVQNALNDTIKAERAKNRLQNVLNNRIKTERTKSVEGINIVLLAHSLGTVIAIDSLVNSNAWKKEDRVWLITMGSPIKRLFQTFYPGIFFPFDISTLSAFAADQVGSLYWLNVYRPLDYVGTKLGLTGNHAGMDKSTCQEKRLRSSHSDYWSDGDDSAVRDTIIAGLEVVTPITLKPDKNSPASTYILPNPPSGEGQLKLLLLLSKILGCLTIIATFSGMLWWVSNSLEDRNKTLKTLQNDLDDKGVVVDASIHYNREFKQRGKRGGRTHIHYYTIKYSSQDPSNPKVVGPLILDESEAFPALRERLDDRKLTDHIRSQCSTPCWKFWKRFRIPCEAGGIRFRYLNDNPDVFDLPDYPPNDYFWDSFTGWFKSLFISAILTSFAMVPFATSVSLFLLLLGHRI